MQKKIVDMYIPLLTEYCAPMRHNLALRQTRHIGACDNDISINSDFSCKELSV